MHKIGKLSSGLSSGAWSRLAAGAITLPFLCTLPRYVDADRPWWNLGLAALIAAVFMAAQALLRGVAPFAQGRASAGAFSVLYLTLGLLGFAGTREYGIEHAFSDLALLYLAFFLAAVTASVAAPLGRAVLALLVVPLAAAALIQAVHMQTFGFAIEAAGYRAILQTSLAEAMEFFSHFLGGALSAGVAAALALVVVVTLAARLPRLSMRIFAAGSLSAAAASPMQSANAEIVAARFAGLTEAIEYAGEIMDYRALRKARGSRTAALPITQEAPLAGRPQTYVFVIGESLSRNHMSLYGYWRKTTPVLESLAGEMAVFTDVVSPHSHTDPSLELVLTLASHSNGLRFTDAGNYSLVEMLRAAGFATWWLSNQHSFGPWDNKTAVLADGAERVHFTGRRSGTIITGPLDETLLEPLDAALRDPAPRKAIFLHMLGSHWDYAKRYPPEAAAFAAPPTPAEIGALHRSHARLHLVSEYDNSVRYHDQLLGQIIERLRAGGRPAVLALFADHGESLYVLKGHYAPAFTRNHVEVPLLLWFSPAYKELAGDVVAQARASSHLAFALEDLPHLLADVIHLRSPVLEAARSPLSAAYRPPSKRYVFGPGHVYENADDPLLHVQRAHRALVEAHPGLERVIWAHRVDTLGKMMEAARVFSGVEIDVVYDAQARALTVNHPPTPPSGLTLDALLGYAGRLKPGLAFWLDIKNLDETNAAQVLEELRRLDARHGLRTRAVVETGHTGPAAEALRKAGFLSSYYLPTAVVTRPVEKQPCPGASEIRRVVEAGRFAAVSYDWRGSAWVEHCLGGFIRERGLRRYTWDLKPILSDPRSLEALDEARLQEYSRVSAVLLPFRSVFDD